MSNGYDNDCVSFNVEDDSPITDPKTRSGPPFEPLHITLAGLRKRGEFCVKPAANVTGEPQPLPRRRRREGDFHEYFIALRDIAVNCVIAIRDNEILTECLA
jgi:hypothetical protein